jgi:4-cresol dehydrogenase (hydroxylating)
MRVPPGVSASDWSAALEQFEQAVGKQWVFTSDEDVALYRDAYSPFFDEPEDRVASAGVAPDSVEQVQAVMRTANRYRVPIYPISTGKNLGYGGSAPNLSGSVVLDLKRMNRILAIDEGRASVLVEPGVSYFDLYRYIQDKGLKLWIDTPDPGWGSPIGNALDHGVGYTTSRFRNHFNSHCGMEVVLANGELVRTGMGAMPNADTWQDYKFGIGPWIDGIFSQSNFGVVTKMGFWLMPAPEDYLQGTVTVPEFDDLHRLIEITNYLVNLGITNGMPGFGTPAFSRGGNFFSRRPPDPAVTAMFANGREPAAQEINAYASKVGAGVWSATLGFYGGKGPNRANWEYCKEKFAAIPGATFKDGEHYDLPLKPEQQTMFDLPRFGIPSLQRFVIGARSEFNQNPTDGHLWFSPLIPRTGEAILAINRLLRPHFSELGFPPAPYIMPASYFERSFIFTFGFQIRHDVQANQKMRATFKRVAELCAQHGWAEYRSPPAFQSLVVGTYSFNNHALHRLHETLKDAIDPNGIIAAGRYDIWPKHLRQAKG